MLLFTWSVILLKTLRSRMNFNLYFNEVFDLEEFCAQLFYVK